MRHGTAFAWALAATIVAGETARVPAPAERAIEQVTQAELRAHVETLAGDEFEGRGLGQPGNARAAEYAAAQLRHAGADPAADGYLQPFEIYRPKLGSDARLIIESSSQTIADVAFGADLWPLPFSADRQATGRIVFAGYGIAVPQRRYDDYRDVDARGAIVLVRDGVPAWVRGLPWLPEADKREFGSASHKLAEARRRGAAALLVIRPSADTAHADWQPEAWQLLPAESRDRIPVAVLSERAADQIRDALKHAELRATLTPGVVVEPVVASNAIGIVQGRDAASSAIVVVGAHLDHDGKDDEGQVFNGADDNASGTAAVLAMAGAFARAATAGDRPLRSVVFALWNGEEQGSLGAEHFLTAPRPAARIVANINLDMVGRSEDVPDSREPRFRGFGRTSAARNGNVVHLLGYSYSPDLARLVNRANETVRLKIKQEYDRGAQGLLRRSDHWAFLKRGVPAIFLTTGLHPDYHTPSDDHDRIEYAKLERIAELAARVAWMAADGEAPEFRRPAPEAGRD